MIKLVDITTKTAAKKMLTCGNNKLDKSIGIWNLPASQEVCGRVCKGCYAMKAQRMYPSVLPSREAKLERSKDTLQFARNMYQSIVKLGLDKVRIHESGDFYSQEYVDNWAWIASSLPNVVFLAYTKRMNDFDFTKLRDLPNVIIVNSLFGKRLNYGKLEKKPENAFLCPAMKCGTDCNHCYDLKNKDSLEKHGIYFEAH